MDVRYVNPFLTAIQNFFETMVEIPFSLGKPTIKKEATASHEISGIIGITGEVLGSVVVSFPEKIALALAGSLLGEEMTEVNADCTDAIGEIANMVAGDAKNGFPETNTSVSVPTVIIGKHKVAYPSGVPIITIPCKTEGGWFALDVALKTKA